MRMLCWPLRSPFSFQGVKERLPRKAAKRLSFARQAPLVFGIIKLFDALVIVTMKAGLDLSGLIVFTQMYSLRLKHFRQCVSKFDRGSGGTSRRSVPQKSDAIS
jgi:hypothetical protein